MTTALITGCASGFGVASLRLAQQADDRHYSACAPDKAVAPPASFNPIYRVGLLTEY
jgi:hypothetical protein